MARMIIDKPLPGALQHKYKDAKIGEAFDVHDQDVEAIKEAGGRDAGSSATDTVTGGDRNR